MFSTKTIQIVETLEDTTQNWPKILHLAKSVFRRRGENPVFIRNIGPQLSCMKSCIFPENLAKRGQNEGCRFDSYQSHFSGFGLSKTAWHRRKSGNKLTSFDLPFSARAFSAQDSKAATVSTVPQRFEFLNRFSPMAAASNTRRTR